MIIVKHKSLGLAINGGNKAIRMKINIELYKSKYWKT